MNQTQIAPSTETQTARMAIGRIERSLPTAWASPHPPPAVTPVPAAHPTEVRNGAGNICLGIAGGCNLGLIHGLRTAMAFPCGNGYGTLGTTNSIRGGLHSRVQSRPILSIGVAWWPHPLHDMMCMHAFASPCIRHDARGRKKRGKRSDASLASFVLVPISPALISYWRGDTRGETHNF